MQGAEAGYDFLLDLAKEILLTVSLGLPRMIGAMSVLSFMGAQLMGGMLARNAIAVTLILAIYPLLEQDIQSAELSTALIIGISVKELFIGMIIGYAVTVVFWGIQAVGYFIDNQRGATMASSFDPLIGEQSSPMGLFMTQSLVALFFVAGVFLVFLDGIYTSYKIWPVTSFFPQLNAGLIDFFVKQFALIAKVAVIVGGPVIITMFLAEFGLGLIGRFAPQLNIFFLSMPIKSAVSNFILVFFWGTLIFYFGDMLRGIKDEIGILDLIFRQAHE